MKTNILQSLAMASIAAASMAPFIVNAAPTVTDYEISWPSDGWYEVQNAQTYESICGGGTSCSVESGAYIVINHTTGQRWEPVFTADIASQLIGSGDSVRVVGNTISWPDDGWYEVQSAQTGTVCGGGSSCTIGDGPHIVINHTTGERWEPVFAEHDDTVIDVVRDSVTVVGNTISWPDNGWYQVQSALTFESLCEGGTSCSVGFLQPWKQRNCSTGFKM